MSRNLKENLYDLLVNRDSRITARYQAYAQSHSGSGRFGAWFYLLGLNLRYGLTRGKTCALSGGKKLPLGPSESQAARLPRPEVRAEELAAYDVVCFDVFDTLIFRPFARPTHLFWQLEGAFAYPNLARLRIRGEELARREKRKTAGTAEVTLPEIWQQVELLTGIPAREGERREWELERKYCFPNPYMLSLTRELEKLGVTTVLISDMYVSAARIQELLTACGYGEFSRCFVSCEHGCSKSDGGLYRVVKKALGEGLRYAQVGDNPHSDGRQAKEQGFTPFPYPNVNAAGRPWRWENMSPITGSVYQGLVNAWMHNGLAAYSHAYELGFVYGGIFCLGYCRWIHQYVTTHGIERILFLARDGDILQKVYGLLYPQEADRCRYVWWSRLAGTKMTAARFPHDYFRRFLHQKVNQGYTLEAVFSAMELSDMLGPFLSHAGWDKETILTPREAREIQSYLQAHWQQVLEHYAPQLQAGKDYFSQALQGASSAVAVDVGWAGSGAVGLDYLVNRVWGLNCPITGLIAGTNTPFSQEPEAAEAMLSTGKLVSYCFSSGHNRDLWRAHNPNRGDNLVVELILGAPQGSFRGFGCEPQFSQPRNPRQAQEIQQGILDYVNFHLERMGDFPPISGYDALAPLRMVMENPKWLQQLEDLEPVQTNLE